MTFLTLKQKTKLVKFYIKTKKSKILSYFVSKSQKNVVWLKLANFIESKWFPTYRHWASCWANVWEALLEFWVKWLPKSGRDWYKWSDILDKNKNFKKVILENPNDALPWAILVYDKWYSKNIDRKNYGHVEIKTNKWFWYGWKQKNKAWWWIIQWYVWYAYYLK